MSSLNPDYLDGNAAAGQLSEVFAVDITTATGRCAECGEMPGGSTLNGPGLVARCSVCGHVLLRLVNVREHTFLDVRGMSYLRIETSQPPR